MSVCPDCNGTGEYRGLNTVEPCQTCKPMVDRDGNVKKNSSGQAFPPIGTPYPGGDMPVTWTYTTKDGLRYPVPQTPIPQHIVPAKQSSPITLEYEIHSISQMESHCHVDTTESWSPRYGFKTTPIQNNFHLRLNNVKSGSHDYQELLKGRRQINLSVKAGEIKQNIENVSLLSYQPIGDKLCNVEFEWIKRPE